MSAPKDLQSELDVLLRAALQQPGVADVLRFHQSTRAAEEAYDASMRVMSPRTISITSASSGDFQAEDPKKFA